MAAVAPVTRRVRPVEEGGPLTVTPPRAYLQPTQGVEQQESGCQGSSRRGRDRWRRWLRRRLGRRPRQLGRRLRALAGTGPGVLLVASLSAEVVLSLDHVEPRPAAAAATAPPAHGNPVQHS